MRRRARREGSLVLGAPARPGDGEGGSSMRGGGRAPSLRAVNVPVVVMIVESPAATATRVMLVMKGRASPPAAAASPAPLSAAAGGRRWVSCGGTAAGRSGRGRRRHELLALRRVRRGRITRRGRRRRIRTGREGRRSPAVAAAAVRRQQRRHVVPAPISVVPRGTLVVLALPFRRHFALAEPPRRSRILRRPCSQVVTVPASALVPSRTSSDVVVVLGMVRMLRVMILLVLRLLLHHLPHHGPLLLHALLPPPPLASAGGLASDFGPVDPRMSMRRKMTVVMGGRIVVASPRWAAVRRG
mmetsp:Transcript_25558/g.75358  ORF Transcript_25558/g.75358 Transcript_25558/m.75358 type:complete len:300 (-) Transcript_25558:387-1286(-)